MHYRADERSAMESSDGASQDWVEMANAAEVIVAVEMKDNQFIGCSCYSSNNGCLSVGEDHRVGDIDILQQVLNHVQPTTILISARAPKYLQNVIQSFADSII